MEDFLPRRVSSYLRRLASLYPAILVTGPRQSGKTYLCRHHFPNHRWILFDDELLAEQANEDPKLFLTNNPPPFILDEVQKAPNLFPALKEYIDTEETECGHIILTGSQPLALMKFVSESLAGRIGLVELFPMTPSEVFQYETFSFDFDNWIKDPPIGETYSWKISPFEFLFRGGFPKMIITKHSPKSEDASTRLKDYIRTYLSKDLRDIASVTNLGRFEKFLRVLASSSGKILDLSDVARQADIPQGTAYDWYELLKVSLIAWSVPGWARNLGKRERKRSKLFVLDSGLVCTLMNIARPEDLNLNPLTGFIFETAAANCVRSSLFKSSTVTPPLYHWNFRNQVEVDLVYVKDIHSLYPIEIKLSSKPSKSDCRGLEAFSDKYPKETKTRIIITTNERCFWLDSKTLHIPLSAL